MSFNFILVLCSFNGTVAFAARVVLSLYALSLGAQPVTIGILAATFSIFPMLLAVTVGKLSDRFGARWPLMFGAAGSGLGMLVPYFMPGLPAVFIAGTLIGLSLVFFNVSTQNLVGLLSTPDNRAKNFSNYSLTISASSLFGPLIAGFSIDHSGHINACLYLALFALVPVAMLVFQGKTPQIGPVRKISRGEKPAGSSFMTMLSDPGVRRMLATGSLLNTGINLYEFYMPVYAHAMGLSASAIGIVLAVNSAAAFVVRAILPWLVARFKEERLLAYAFFIGAGSLVLVPFFDGFVMLAVLSFIFGLGMGCGQPIVTMLMFSSAPEGRSGEGIGLKVTVNQLTKLVSPVVFGAIASAFGLSPMFWLNALLLGTGGMMSRPRKRG